MLIGHLGPHGHYEALSAARCPGTAAPVVRDPAGQRCQQQRVTVLSLHVIYFWDFEKKFLLMLNCKEGKIKLKWILFVIDYACLWDK